MSFRGDKVLELPTVQHKLRNRLEDFERTFEIPLLMRGSTPEDRGGGDGGLDYAVSVAVELAISRGEFPTTQEANRESRELLDEARIQMASMYDGLSSPGLLEVSESPTPAQRSSGSSSSPEQVHENPGDVGVAEEPSAPASFLRLDTTPVSSKSPESQGQWGEILSPSKLITPLYAPPAGGAATPGPGISLLEASSLGDFGSPPTDKMTTRSLPQRSHTVSDLREDSGSSDDVSFHSPMAFARSPVVVQHGPVRLSLREQRERLKAAKTTRGLDEAATVLSRLIPQAEGNVGPTTPEMEVQAAAVERRSRIKPTVLPGMDRPRRRKAGIRTFVEDKLLYNETVRRFLPKGAPEETSHRDEGVEGFVWWCYVLTLSVMFYYKYKIWKRDPEHARVRKEAWQSYYDHVQDENADMRVTTPELPLAAPSRDLSIDSEGNSVTEEEEAAAVASNRGG
ncbi:hypothetical protein FOZ60_013458 [Perkinsus olseni]|uniref:Uncharacterized protein n=1 Tax=Perkinsus olseni TaxID=32597 RepID=A0A7J6NAG4_PEROL|nr:hypothetical protein FOZ60_013458 [Perkinsus olseni]